MGSIVLYMSMSLDGFITGPDDGPGQGLGLNGSRLFRWLDERNTPGPNKDVFDELMATGAVIAGRRTYENADHWQGDHHDGVPVFVLTHHPPETPPPGSVRFATDGADDCAGQAKAAAGERNVMVHGAGAAQSLLRAGVLDELELHLVPVLLGQGRLLFDALGPDHIELELTRAIEAPHVTICTTASSGRHSRPYAPASRPSTRAAGRSLGSRGGRNAGSAAGVLRGRPKCLELRERYEQFKRRDLYDTHLIALFLDATFIAVRPDGPEEGVLVAWGFSAEGERVLLSVTLGMRESFEDSQALGRDLIARGLGGAPMLIVADGAPWLIKAIEQCWPVSTASAAACTARATSNAKLPERERERVKQAYWRALDDAISPSDANQRLKALVDELDRGGYTIAARCLADDLDALVVHLRYPPRHRRRWRSTNLLERSLREVKRRTKVIGRFPGEQSCLTLVWAVLDLLITHQTNAGRSSRPPLREPMRSSQDLAGAYRLRLQLVRSGRVFSAR
jgi:dihydrofolate reductase